MKICMIGTGYVGLVSGVCFSDLGNDVICVDKDQNKINNLKQGIIPIYEPGLEELVLKNYKNKRLNFSTDLNNSIKKSDIVFICVGTPTKKNGTGADLGQIYSVAKEISSSINRFKIIITKSTVPVTTGDEIEKIISKKINKEKFSVVSNPEFLREGNAIQDFMRPDRVVVGYESEKAKNIISALYKPLYLIETPILFTDLKTAELIKYSANAFLALKISYINQMADLCEKVGADVHGVAKGIGLDKRIGSKFLHPGPGYGGSCFPKDTLALVKTANENNSNISIIETVIKYNSQRKSDMASKILKELGNDFENKKVSILGLSFKPETDDMRDSPSLDIIPLLQEKGITISAFDPVAMDEARKLLKNIEFADNLETCLQNSDALVILTEWNEFRSLFPEDLSKYMKGKLVIDLRNALNPENFIDSDFALIQIGRARNTNQ